MSSLLPILSDQPAAEDQLDFAPYAKTLADIAADIGTEFKGLISSQN